MKWTGKDVANLMRSSRYKWNSGDLARGNSNCAVGMLVRALGVPQDYINDIDIPYQIENIFGYNDEEKSKKAAAAAIEQNFQDLPVDELEERIKEHAEEHGYKLKPNCRLLDKVKAAHKD